MSEMGSYAVFAESERAGWTDPNGIEEIGICIRVYKTDQHHDIFYEDESWQATGRGGDSASAECFESLSDALEMVHGEIKAR